MLEPIKYIQLNSDISKNQYFQIITDGSHIVSFEN